MSEQDLTIRPVRPQDAAAVKNLHERVLGPGRFARTAHRIREGGNAAPVYCFTAWSDERFVGSIRFSAVLIGGREGALLLGPLTIDPDVSGRGYGIKLIEQGIRLAGSSGYELVLLVGDLAYYKRAGFVQVQPEQIRLPGPIDPARLLGRELKKNALQYYSGLVTAV